MAHEIRSLDRVGYSFRPAWHGLGRVFDHQMTRQDLIEVIGAQVVVQGRGYVPIDNRTNRPFSPKEAIDMAHVQWLPTEAIFNFRDDISSLDKRALLSPAGVGEGYEVIQNMDLIDTVDEILGRAQANYETCGTLRDGQMVWILAKWPEGADVKGDKIEQYLLIYNSHDSSKALTIQPTSIRVVCYNTLSWALGPNFGPASGKGVSLKHTANVKTRIQEAIRAIKNCKKSFDKQSEVFNGLSKKAITDRFVEGYLKALYPDPKAGKNTTQAEKKRDRIRDLIDTQAGANLPSMRTDDGLRNGWALYNAVCQYHQYESTIRVREGADRNEQSFRSNLFGTQSARRALAVETLMRSDELETAAATAIASN